MTWWLRHWISVMYCLKTSIKLLIPWMWHCIFLLFGKKNYNKAFDAVEAVTIFCLWNDGYLIFLFLVKGFFGWYFVIIFPRFQVQWIWGWWRTGCEGTETKVWCVYQSCAISRRHTSTGNWNQTFSQRCYISQGHWRHPFYHWQLSRSLPADYTSADCNSNPIWFLQLWQWGERV